MMADNPHDPEDLFDSWVIAYHDALADTGPDTPISAVSAPAELEPRLQRAQACLQMLERVWPRARSEASKPDRAAELPRTIGRFRIRKQLGCGAFGIVFLAEDPTLGRLVALKVPRAETLLHPELRRRFVWEAETAAGLNHPHVVPVHEAGEAGSILYIASEFCPGPTLADWLAHRHSPVPPRSAAALMATLADAICYVHSRGILHRDLKPSNILLVPSIPGQPPDLADALESFTPRVTDFGLAKVLEREAEATRTGAALGTPRYAAPEQAGGRAADIAWPTDVYALGVILYELLTGAPPFTGPTVHDTWQQVLTCEPGSPSRRASVPRDLETICLKCLRKAPAARYPSAADLAGDLRRFLDGRPIQARPVGLCERTLRWARRKPAHALLIALGFLTAVTVAAGWWHLSDAAQQTALHEERRHAAEEIAAANEYHALVSKVAELAANPQLGWSWQGLEDIQKAAGLQTDARDPVRLRSLAARCLATPDLRKVAVFADKVNAFCLAFSPDGTRLAIGENWGAASAAVLLYDVPGRRLLQTFRCSSASLLHGARVRALGFSPDGRWLAAGMRHGAIRVWDTTGKSDPIHLPAAHSAEVTGLGFSPDGKSFASCSNDKSVKLWDRQSWKAVNSRSFNRPLSELVFSPDGRLLFCASDEWCEFLLSANLSDAPEAAVPILRWQHRVCFSPDGRFFAFLNRNHIGYTYLQSVGVFRLHTVSAPFQLAHEEAISHIEFNADSTLLLSSAADQRAHLWEVATKKVLATIQVTGRGRVYASFSPDGRHIAVTEEERTVLYEMGGFTEATVLAPHLRPVRAMAFAPDGSALGTIAHESREIEEAWGEFALWRISDGRLRTINAVERGRGDVELAGRPALAFHPNSEAVLYRGDSTTGAVMWDLRQSSPRKLPDLALTSALGFAPSGKTLWGVLDRREKDSEQPKRSDADQLVSRDWPGLKVASRWVNQDPWTRERLGSLTAVAVGNQWILAGSSDGYTNLFRAARGDEPHKQWRSPERYAVNCVALSPDETLAVCGTQSGAVQIVRVPDGEPVATWSAHTASVESIGFSPDGKVMATASKDHRVRLWQRTGDSFRELLSLTAPGPLVSCCFSPDGNKLALLVQNERAVRLWHLDRLRSRLASLGLEW